ncbi:MAG: CHASE2 domain-containing protein, partial [Planctomycetes bacterium]|nr:CHASE2 domain-containing protein [Planctomycetota bacterium]
DAIELRRSVDAIESRLPVASSAFDTAQRIQTPVLPIVEGASAVGFVTAEPDRDGTMRRLPLFENFGGHLYPQLGIAAAAPYLSVAPADVEVQPASVRLGRVTLPNRHARTLVSWPQLGATTGLADWWNLVRGRDASLGALGVLRQSAADPPTAGHVPIGPLALLPIEEDKLAKQKDRLDQLGKLLVRDAIASSGAKPEDLDDPVKRNSVMDAIRGEAAFNLGDPPAAPSPDDSDVTKVFRTWLELDRSVARGGAELERVTARLREKIAGKLVFVGWTTSGDVYPTAADALTPGVVVNAAFASMPLTGYAIGEASRGLGVLVAFFIGSLGAAAGGIGRVGPRTGLLALLTLAIAYAFVNAFLVFETGRVFLALATPLASLVAGWAAATVTRQVSLLREKARLSRQFGARVHKRLFEYLLEHPDVIDVAGVQREVTMLFTDLAGFTSVSESLDSHETVALLNQYMGAMNQVLTEHDAYVNKFLGDGIMAVWGAFDDGPDHGEKACRAGVACIERLERLKREAASAVVAKLNMRVGIATGVVTVGDCGAPPDFSDYTVIGDAVNLASRLESANKQFGTRIAIDGRTRELAGPNVIVRPLGAFIVVGQSKPTVVFECLGVKGSERAAELESQAEETRLAVESFQNGRLEESRVAWQEFVAKHGDSKLAHIYLEEIDDVLERPQRPFDGSIALTAK